ncbi:hypothetical protein BD410DRAFT_810173 [Rickenella mellea]|uniref:Uncharacterized protein n=1 Tax=Rickenella mellea TaxID=50990 RepID=A0A4Y7PFT0_9AGAM|nr:hypothetical protein BD410DRAFT_810173 [Rickenella mellea]
MPRTDPILCGIIEKYVPKETLTPLQQNCPSYHASSGNYHFGNVGNNGVVWDICGLPKGVKNKPTCHPRHAPDSMQLDAEERKALVDEIRTYTSTLTPRKKVKKTGVVATPRSRPARKSGSNAVVDSGCVVRDSSPVGQPIDTEGLGNVKIECYVYMMSNQDPICLEVDAFKQSDGRFKFVLDLQLDLCNLLEFAGITLTSLEYYDHIEQCFTNDFPSSYLHLLSPIRPLIYKQSGINRFECPGLHKLITNLPFQHSSPVPSSSQASPSERHGKNSLKRKASSVGEQEGIIKRSRVMTTPNTPSSSSSSSSSPLPSSSVTKNISYYDFTGDDFDEDMSDSEFLDTLEYFERSGEEFEMAFQADDTGKGKGNRSLSSLTTLTLTSTMSGKKTVKRQTTANKQKTAKRQKLDTIQNEHVAKQAGAEFSNPYVKHQTFTSASASSQSGELHVETSTYRVQYDPPQKPVQVEPAQPTSGVTDEKKPARSQIAFLSSWTI